MKIHIEHNGTSFTFERTPMEPERFNAVCKLAMAAIAGAVLLGAIAMIGAWVVGFALGMLVLYGLYQGFKELCR